MSTSVSLRRTRWAQLRNYAEQRVSTAEFFGKVPFSPHRWEGKYISVTDPVWPLTSYPYSHLDLGVWSSMILFQLVPNFRAKVQNSEALGYNAWRGYRDCPLEWAVSGAETISGKEEDGIAPPRMSSPNQVSRIHDSLSEHSRSSFLTCYRQSVPRHPVHGAPLLVGWRDMSAARNKAFFSLIWDHLTLFYREAADEGQATLHMMA